jgi:hypothetical protein
MRDSLVGIVIVVMCWACFFVGKSTVKEDTLDYTHNCPPLQINYSVNGVGRSRMIVNCEVGIFEENIVISVLPLAEVTEQQ